MVKETQVTITIRGDLMDSSHEMFDDFWDFVLSTKKAKKKPKFNFRYTRKNGEVVE
jgi:hypothetical protein